MRLFVAVDLPDELKEKLASLQSRLSSIIIGNFVRKESFHINLKFLGWVDDSSVEDVKSACRDAIPKLSKVLSLSVQGVGAFPSQNYVRVIWAGLSGDVDELASLQKGVDQSLAKFRELETREFTSHITLARVKSVKDKDALAKFFGANRETEFGSFKVSKVKLMKSELRRTGAEYEEVAIFRLK